MTDGQFQRAKRGDDLITHSRGVAFKDCRKLHHYSYTLGVRPEATEALRIGGAIHDAIDLLRCGGKMCEAVARIVANYAKLIQSACDPDWVDSLRTEEMKCICLVAGWEWRWRNDPVKVVASELPFVLPIKNPKTGRTSRRYKQAGKIDAILELVDPRLVVGELKTSGYDIQLGSPYWDRVRLDTQITGYLVAARAKGYPVVSILYDVIHKPGIAPKLVTDVDDEGRKIVLEADGQRSFKRDGSPRESGDKAKGYTLKQHRETPEEYGERLMEEIHQKPEVYFARVEITRTEDDIEEFRRELWQLQKDVAADAHGDCHYRNPNACFTPYRCGHLGPCSNHVDLSNETPEGFVRLDFIHPELEEMNDDNSNTGTAAGQAGATTGNETIGAQPACAATA